jgi:serine/threonine protein kinase
VAEICLCHSLLAETVKSAYMQTLIGEVRERFEKSSDGLRAFEGRDAEELSHGADGYVYKLPDGTVAKLGDILHHEQIPSTAPLCQVAIGLRPTLPNPHMERAKLEIRMATAAGKLGVSPKVRDSFFCCSPMKCYYVIILERVDGPILHKWLASAAQADKEAMYKKIDSLLDKLHQAGIVHNDLHQGNIIIDKSGNPLIVDFSRSTFWKEQLRSQFSNSPGHSDSLVDLVIMDLIEMGHLTHGAFAQRSCRTQSVQPAQQS